MASPTQHHRLECPLCEAELYVELRFTAYACDCTNRHDHAHVAVIHNADSVVADHVRTSHES